MVECQLPKLDVAGSSPVSRSKNQPHSLRRVPDGSLPSEQEKVATAKRATVGLKKPVESFLDGVSDAYTSKLDGSAMWTASGEYPTCGLTHGSNLQLSPHCPRQGRLDLELAAWSRGYAGRRAGRRPGGSPPVLP